MPERRRSRRGHRGVERLQGGGAPRLEDHVRVAGRVSGASGRRARLPFGSDGTLFELRTHGRDERGVFAAARARAVVATSTEPDTATHTTAATTVSRRPAPKRIKESVFSVPVLVDDATAPAHALPEGRLGAVLAGFVIDMARHLGWTVVLFDPAPGVVVGVPVPLTVAQVSGTAVVGVTQMGGDVARGVPPGRRPGPGRGRW